MRRRKKSEAFDALSDGWINLTPLIDVLFVILIAFILVAPLVNIDQVKLAPASFLTSKDLPQNRGLMIYVKGDNSIWIDERKVTFDALINILEEKKKKFPEKIPQVIHDEKATFGTYEKVKDCVERAGFKEMDVILQSR